MSDTPISLASLMTPSKTVSIDFPGYKGFTVDLTYLAREELLKLRKKCVSTKFNKKTHQPEEILDFAHDKLADFMFPRFIEFVDQLPKSEVHRIMKRFLKDRGLSENTYDREKAGYKIT